MKKIFVSTVPFSSLDAGPLQILNEAGFQVISNPLNRKLSAAEVAELAVDFDGIIAGTEDLSKLVESTSQIKIIARVGVGLDSVPLTLCQEKNIAVTYTPDAVTDAVAELTIGSMIGISRQIPLADRRIREHSWKRLFGKRIGASTVGIIGLGRIGKSVVKLLQGFKPLEVLVNDIKDIAWSTESLKTETQLSIRQCTKEEIYQKADFISVHVPLNAGTKNMINSNVFSMMKADAYLLNYARGGIVDEEDLFQALDKHQIAGAAIDTFEREPYEGNLTQLDNVLLTQHMGSCSYDCRAKMELEAAEEIVRFFDDQPLLNPVPEEEY